MAPRWNALSTFQGKRGPTPTLGESEVGIGKRPGMPHLTPALCRGEA
jgi:hypothetical protein